MFNLKTYLETKKILINMHLQNFMQTCSSPDRVTAAMNYSLNAPAKRIRPILCLAVAEAVGGNEAIVMTTACAIEMIHTYSLIHDDLPAMDNDDLRRGRPSCHIAFDDACAILAGDALLTMAFEILAEHSKNNQTLNIIRIIARAAGHKGMICGQNQDIISEGQNLTQAQLEQMHTLKTGRLIKAAVISGALLGNGTPEQINCLEVYADNIGLAFQVMDDILNVEGDPALLGKAVGSDQKHSKNTYPAIMGLEHSKTLARDLIARAQAAIAHFDVKAHPLRVLAQYVIERKN